MDVSAQANFESMSADVFLETIKETVPEYFDVFDGWTSHSYPNPAFSSSPYISGRTSIRSYLWERQLLYSLGILKNYPILIGETGWAHNSGLAKTSQYLSPEVIANYIAITGNTVWQDPNIFAITPFLYNYESQPFDVFSWKKIGGGYHPHYFAYQKLAKTRGTPRIRESYAVKNTPVPPTLVTDSVYTFVLNIENTGQAIVASTSGYSLILESTNPEFSLQTIDFPELEPNQVKEFNVQLLTPSKEGEYRLQIFLQRGKLKYLLSDSVVAIIAPPKLEIHVQLGFKKIPTNQFVKVIVYDGNRVLHEFESLVLMDGKIFTPGLHSVVPGTTYRIVTIIPYYLPRQNIQIINETITPVLHRRFYPWDTNSDQAFTLKDLRGFFFHPKSVFERLFSL
jgi:archaellum component FlaG (FlaF/FlaG flagellin family)